MSGAAAGSRVCHGRSLGRTTLPNGLAEGSSSARTISRCLSPSGIHITVPCPTDCHSASSSLRTNTSTRCAANCSSSSSCSLAICVTTSRRVWLASAPTAALPRGRSTLTPPRRPPADPPPPADAPRAPRPAAALPPSRGRAAPLTTRQPRRARGRAAPTRRRGAGICTEFADCRRRSFAAIERGVQLNCEEQQQLHNDYYRTQRAHAFTHGVFTMCVRISPK